MMKKFCIFLLALSSFTADAQKKTTADKRFAGLDAQFEQVLKDWKVPGFAVAVVHKDQVIYAKGFGYRDYEARLPVTPNTLFAIGSVTKSFTAALMGQLRQDGKVDFNKPAVSYLPGMSFFNDAMNNSVTLRHMMSHQTGLPRHDFSWYFFNTASRDSMLQRVHYQEPTAGIGARWQYNNFMFAAQGAIAEKLTGKAWEEAVRTRIFQPLGMTRSNFSVLELPKSGDAAYGYGLKGDTLIHRMPYYNINAMGPAGSINSSVNEMAAWLITWIHGGKYQGKEVLPAAYITEAISAQAIIGAGLPGKEKPDLHFSAYGFGWMLSSYRGHYRVEHGGNIDGFSANAAFFPTDSIGIVVLTNQNGSAVPSIVRNMLSDRLLGLKSYDWNGDQKKAREKAKTAQKEAAAAKVARAGTRPTHPLTDYAGTYTHPGYGTLAVTAKGDSLFAKTVEHTLWLRHNNYNVFDPYVVNPITGIDTTDNMPLPVQFRLSVTGDIESLAIPFESGLEPLIFKRGALVTSVAKGDLEKYVGEYELAGMTVKVYTKNENTLFVLVPGQPEYELLPNARDKFALKVVSGYYVQFGVNDKGVVSDLTFIQPNGSFKATKKK